ncbi:MAG: leucine-rich repeat protein [Treponemataceae bacterium]
MKKFKFWIVSLVLVSLFFGACKQSVAGGDKAKEAVPSYTIMLDLDGGTISPEIEGNKLVGKKGEKVKKPADPTKDGYIFDSWEPAIPEKFLTENIKSTARWEPSTDTHYTVKHLKEKLDGGYDEEIENPQGTTGGLTEAKPKTYEGFEPDETVEQKKIKADGTTIVEIKYKRKEITITLDLDGGTGTTELKGKYGADVAKPTPKKQGYTFAGWDKDIPTFPAENTTITAKWNPSTDTPYTVKHLKENVDGNGYDEEIEDRQGTTGENTKAEPKTYEGFKLDETVEQQMINPDGTTVIEIKYKRKEITITLDLYGGTGTTTKLTGKYGVDVTKPADPTKDGYKFDGWKTTIPTTFPAENTIITAKWLKLYQISISGSEQTKINEHSHIVTEGTRWSEIKEEINKKCEYIEYHTNAYWSLDNADGKRLTADYGKDLDDDYTFNEDTIIFCQSTYDPKYFKSEPNKITGYSGDKPQGFMIIPKETQVIADRAFKECTGITTLDLSNCTNLTEMDWNAFRECTNITEVIFPDSLTKISQSAFSGCTGISVLDLSNCTNLTVIDERAFSGIKITSLDLSGCTSLNKIGQYAFVDCTSITEVTFPDSLNTI